jgi:hypothetical protein
MTLRSLVACVSLLGCSISAEAQDKAGLTLAAGAIVNADPPPAENFTEPFYFFSVQGVFKKYFAIEGDASYFAHIYRNEQGPHDVFGPSGAIGHVERSEIVDTNKDLILGANFLVKSSGRVRVFGGVGAAMVFEGSSYEQQSFGCSPSLDPRSCTRFVNNRTNGPLPLFRVLGGVEVSIADHAAIVGAVRRDSLTWEDSSTNVAITGGIRIGVP